MKFIFLIIMIINILYAQNMNYALENNQALTLSKNKLQFSASYLIINEDIDIFDVRASELGTSSSSLGDLDGFDFGIRYGISDKLNLFLNYNYKKLDYLDGELKNKKLNFFGRYQLYDNLNIFFNSLSLDVGYKTNFANKLSISSENRLNSMIDRVYPNSNISIKNQNITIGEDTYSLFDKDGNKISPSINIDNLNEDSFYFKLLLGKKNHNSVLNLYFSYKRSSINSSIFINPYNQTMLDMLNLNGFINLDRKEDIFSIGINKTLEMFGFITEIGYEFSKISRDNDLDILDIDHKISFNISKPIKKDLLFFIGGDLFLRQFNTEIPYLLNDYTKHSFYKKYGYVKAGVVLTFDSSKLF